MPVVPVWSQSYERGGPDGQRLVLEAGIKCANLLANTFTLYKAGSIIRALDPNGPQKYQATPMFPAYFAADIWRTNYLPLEEIRNSEIEFDSDTQRWRFKTSGSLVSAGTYTLVMYPDGRIYIRRNTKHSSLTWGRAIASAGELVFNQQGNITEFIPKTGHYWLMFRNGDRHDPHLNWQNLVSEMHLRGAPVLGLQIPNIYYHRDKGLFTQRLSDENDPLLYGFSIDQARLDEALERNE